MQIKKGNRSKVMHRLISPIAHVIRTIENQLRLGRQSLQFFYGRCPNRQSFVNPDQIKRITSGFVNYFTVNAIECPIQFKLHPNFIKKLLNRIGYFWSRIDKGTLCYFLKCPQPLQGSASEPQITDIQNFQMTSWTTVRKAFLLLDCQIIPCSIFIS